jgi:hypothetical protein
MSNPSHNTAVAIGNHNLHATNQEQIVQRISRESVLQRAETLLVSVLKVTIPYDNQLMNPFLVRLSAATLLYGFMQEGYISEGRISVSKIVANVRECVTLSASQAAAVEKCLDLMIENKWVVKKNSNYRLALDERSAEALKDDDAWCVIASVRRVLVDLKSHDIPQQEEDVFANSNSTQPDAQDTSPLITESVVASSNDNNLVSNSTELNAGHISFTELANDNYQDTIVGLHTDPLTSQRHENSEISENAEVVILTSSIDVMAGTNSHPIGLDDQVPQGNMLPTLTTKDFASHLVKRFLTDLDNLSKEIEFINQGLPEFNRQADLRQHFVSIRLSKLHSSEFIEAQTWIIKQMLPLWPEKLKSSNLTQQITFFVKQFSRGVSEQEPLGNFPFKNVREAKPKLETYGKLLMQMQSDLLDAKNESVIRFAAVFAMVDRLTTHFAYLKLYGLVDNEKLPQAADALIACYQTMQQEHIPASYAKYVPLKNHFYDRYILNFYNKFDFSSALEELARYSKDMATHFENVSFAEIDPAPDDLELEVQHTQIRIKELASLMLETTNSVLDNMRRYLDYCIDNSKPRPHKRVVKQTNKPVISESWLENSTVKLDDKLADILFTVKEGSLELRAADHEKTRFSSEKYTKNEQEILNCYHGIQAGLATLLEHMDSYFHIMSDSSPLIVERYVVEVLKKTLAEMSQERYEVTDFVHNINEVICSFFNSVGTLPEYLKFNYYCCQNKLKELANLPPANSVSNGS